MQFSLLVVTNAFVGSMVGLERTLLPLVAEPRFGVASATAALAFIASFGVTKAALNLVAGPLADRYGRRSVLIAGWLVGLPVPLILYAAPAWSWVIAANVLLGVNQALAWSMTVNMKIDLARPHERGLALGLNEFAGYTGLALMAGLTGWLAGRVGARPELFLIGLGVAVLGLALSLFARETHPHGATPSAVVEAPPSFVSVARRGSGGDRTLTTASLAGLATNLKDGVLWGLLPLWLAAAGTGVRDIGLVVGAYPLIWGLSQLATGPLSDKVGRRPVVLLGLALQGLGTLAFLWAVGLTALLAAAAVVGLGTGLVYPTLLAVVADVAEPSWRASALGVYRGWRDLGFAAGALGSGLIADLAGLGTALQATGAFVLVVGAIALWGLPETRPRVPGVGRGPAGRA